MGNTNYDWAALVMSRCSPPITPTVTNTGNFTRWMGAENPPHQWWHLNNPLNCGLNDGSADGEGSYPSLDFAATETAKVLSQSNMRNIYNALATSASTAVFSAGCANSAWSTGGYHGKPGFIATVPQEAVISSGQNFTTVTIGPGPSPGPAPAPPPAPVPVPHQEESQMLTRNTSSVNGGGYWGVRPNANVYTFDGAQYIGPHATWSAKWGIGTPSNPVVGIEDDGVGGFALLTDNGGPQPEIYNIPADGRYKSAVT